MSQGWRRREEARRERAAFNDALLRVERSRNRCCWTCDGTERVTLGYMRAMYM